MSSLRTNRSPGLRCQERSVAARVLCGLLFLSCGLMLAGITAGHDNPAVFVWPSPSAMRTLTMDLLKREAESRDAQAKADALIELCDLYVTLRHHPKHAESEIVKGEATRVRRRLITAGRQLSGRLKREQVSRPDELTSRVDAAIAEALQATTSQQAPSLRDPSTPRGGYAPGSADGNAWQLVELIQRTVHPDFWEPAGGPGSIRYFAMKRVLAVRATTEVHEELAALLRQL